MVDAIADRIVEKLAASVIPSSIPAEIGQLIRDACKHGGSMYRHVIPLAGPMAIFANYRMNPDGTLNFELQDTNGCPFWHGTFRPAEVPNG